MSVDLAALWFFMCLLFFGVTFIYVALFNEAVEAAYRAAIDGGDHIPRPRIPASRDSRGNRP
jgi:hypothetical protein